ncbi:RDD family protein [Pedobacter soli]|uniref:RDD domain-containing protein n=1 Tax=Pedobacter soli TaxID=390242 RepID=A0A1G6PIQ4_9SPHI|nr:RDD family protein [Pedobacter soli]SDC79406.1 hypothetical protein SAMN04488024_10351 [Pedobacter soli]
MKKSLIILLLLIAALLYHIIISIDFFSALLQTVQKGSPFYLTNYIFPIILLFNLLGILIFAFSNYKRTALLRIVLLYFIFSQMFFFLIRILNAVSEDQDLILKIEIRHFTMWIVAIGLNTYILLYLQKQLKPKLTKHNNEFEFTGVSKMQRLLHRIVDIIFVFCFLYYNIDFIDRIIFVLTKSENSFLSTIGYIFNYQDRIYLPVYFSLFFYYLISEGIFNTSMGKIILGNTIVDEIAGRPNTKQRIGRTFARLIPFEALSFIFLYRGWHDSITETYVVKTDKSSKNENE